MNPDDEPRSRQRPRAPKIAALLALGALAAACGGDGDSAPDTTAPPVTEPATTAAPTTTSEPTTTIAPAATSSTTTTIAPTTTEDPAVALAAEVEAAYLASWEALNIAGQSPTDEALVNDALDGFTGASLDAVRASLDDLAANGLRLVLNDVVQAQTQIVVDASPIPEDDTRFAFEECETDSWIVVETGAGPNGTDAIVNDEVNSYHNRVVMALVDGAWRVENSTEIRRYPGASCEELSS